MGNLDEEKERKTQTENSIIEKFNSILYRIQIKLSDTHAGSFMLY